MKKAAKLLAVIISVMMIISCLAGCNTGTNKEKTEGKSETSTAQSKVTESEKKSVAEDPNVNNPGVFPIVKKSIKLKIFTAIGNNYIIEDNEWFDYIKDLTNIEIEVDNTTGEAARQKVNLILASQSNLPDVFMIGGDLSLEQLATYGSEGVFVNLKDYSHLTPEFNVIEENEPTLIKAITMNDGGVYSFLDIKKQTHVMYSQRMWVNKVWLDKLEMKLPETIDEFYKMLVAFKNNDCNGNGENDEIPMAALKTGTGWKTDLAGFLMNPFVPATDLNQLYMYNDNGTIKSAILEEEYKEGIRFLQKLYKEELLDEEIFTLTAAQIKTLTGNPSGNRVGAICHGTLSGFNNVAVPGSRDEWVVLPPLKGKDGVRRTPYFKPMPTNNYTITSQSKNIEAAVRLGDFFMTDPFSGDEKDMETFLNNQYGPNGWESLSDPSKKTATGDPAKFALTYTYGEPTNLNIGNIVPRYTTDDIVTIKQALVSGDFSHGKILYDAANIYAQYAVDITVPKVIVASDKTIEAAEYKQLSLDFYEEKMAQFIIGDLDIDKDWDEFISQIKTLGLEKYVQIIQEAYDARYK